MAAFALRDRCQCPSSASAFGALRKSANDRQGPAMTRLTHSRHAERKSLFPFTDNCDPFAGLLNPALCRLP
jgi:hypothetical protein